MEGKKRTRRSGGERGHQMPKMRKSCDSCALAKRKCDGKISCSLCVKRDSPCVYSERQKSGPKGNKIDEESDECATAVAASPTASLTASRTAPPVAAVRTPHKSAKRAPGPARASSVIRPPEKTHAAQPEPATTGWQSSAREDTLPPTPQSAKVATSAFVPRSPPSTSKPRPKPRKVAAKEPRPQHQKKNRKLQEQRGARKATVASSAAVPVRKKIAPPAAATPPRLPLPPVSATKLVPLSTVMPDEGKRTLVKRSSTYAGASSRSAEALSVSRNVPASLSEPTVDGSSSGWEGVPGIFVASAEDEVLWSCDDFSDEDGRVVGVGDNHNHFRQDNFFEAPQALLTKKQTSLPRGGGPGNGPPPPRASNPRAASPSVVFSRRHAPSSLEFKPLAYGVGGAGSGTAMNSRGGFMNEREIIGGGGHGMNSSPISMWTQEAVEAGASTLLAVLSDCGPPSSASGAGDAWGHHLGKRSFLSWPSQIANATGGGVRDGFGTGGSVPRNGFLSRPPALAAADGSPRPHTAAAQQQRGSSQPCDTRNFTEYTSTAPLDGAPWAWNGSKRHLAAF